ncbi:hypothetical protein LBMAG18_01140 [Alphaproteobacteria bacterium]|nr:hypothetical protein LBMAG18_01140 [Alphaproteobacteria bacterium]
MDLIGFEENKTQLSNFFKNEKLHHANLILGKKGIGKASFIKQLCKDFLGCKSDIHPDLKIISCLEDKKEIIIEQIRDVIEFSYQTPASSPNKFVIIDSACELNKNSSNALLKLLEEPLPSNYFFLITHNFNKIIPTIRSRCNIVKIEELNSQQFNQILQNHQMTFSKEQSLFLEMICDNSPAIAIEHAHDFIKLYQLFIQSILDKKINEELLKKISEKNYNFYVIEKIINVFLSRFIKNYHQLLDNFFFAELESFELLKPNLSFDQAISIFDDICKKTPLISSHYIDKKLLLINILNTICYEKI